MNPRVVSLLLVLVTSGSGGLPAFDTPGTAGQAQKTSATDQAQPKKRGGRITGFVFEDKNLNGSFDAGDTRLAKQTVVLTTPDRAKTLTSATTATDGGFRFDDLVANDYRVTVRIPDGYVRTTDDSFVVTITDSVEQTARFGIAPRPVR